MYAGMQLRKGQVSAYASVKVLNMTEYGWIMNMTGQNFIGFWTCAHV